MGGDIAIRRLRTTILRCAFILVALLPVLSCDVLRSADSGKTLTPRDVPIPDSYFSLNILFHPLNKVPWPAVPFYGWRVWHALWADLEPQKGVWQFDLLDKYVDWAQQHHTEMLMLLAYSPRWASNNPANDADWYPGASGPLADMNDWKTFVRTVATRYQGRIHVYEIWNEPNRKKAWIGDVQTMADMTRAASEILKEVDSSNIVVSPAPTGPQSIGFFKDFLSKGGGKYVDVIGYHFYLAPNDPPEAMVPLIQQVKAAMQQFGVADKSLWDTEAGWLGDDFFSDDQQSAYVARAFILNWAAGVDRFYWYAWESHHGSQIELTRKDNATLTAAGTAFVAIQQWMTGSVMKRCQTSDNQSWVCQLDKGGRTEYLVWNAAGSSSFHFPKEWRITQMTQLSGSRSEIQGDTVSIGIQPVLLQ
jgi:hypothetical protein